MQKVTIHLNFGGNCETAFKFYEKHLGGKITFMMPWGDSPMAKETPKGWEKKVMHASYELDGYQILGADAPLDKFEKPQGFAVCLSYEKPADAERVFKALSQGGKMQMPMQETFWAQRFGMVTDQFGTPWMVNCHKPE